MFLKSYSTMSNRLGEQNYNNKGNLMTIICYVNSMCVDIKFESGFVAKCKNYSDFKKGSIKDLYSPSIFNVGYVGEGYFSSISHPNMYERWYNMLKRCYSQKCHKKYPTYKDCFVVSEWHCLQKFGSWYEENFKPWMVDNWHLDKDVLLKNNKVYSPDTCAFVPHEINSLFTKSNSIRGKCPIGVYFEKVVNKYRCRYNKNGRLESIGLYLTPEEAFYAYKEDKENYIKEVADKWRYQLADNVHHAMINYKVEITD